MRDPRPLFRSLTLRYSEKCGKCGSRWCVVTKKRSRPNIKTVDLDAGGRTAAAVLADTAVVVTRNAPAARRSPKLRCSIMTSPSAPRLIRRLWPFSAISPWRAVFIHNPLSAAGSRGCRRRATAPGSSGFQPTPMNAAPDPDALENTRLTGHRHGVTHPPRVGYRHPSRIENLPIGRL